MASEYLLAGTLVFAVNLLPVFGPPTWAVLVFLRLNSGLAPVPLVLVGALSAALGRFVLATASRRLRRFMSPKRLASHQAAEEVLSGSRRRAAAGLALFALSPVPSAQLFIAAGIMTVPLVPLTAAFFAGRLVSYSIYVAAASATKHSFGSVIGRSLTSPLGIGLQVAMLAGLVALVRVDWAALLARRRGAKDEGGGQGGAEGRTLREPR